MAAGALPGVGAHRRGICARRRQGRDGTAAPRRLHALERPPLRLSSRRDRSLRGVGGFGARAWASISSLPRLDVAWRIQGRPASRQRGGGRGRDPRRRRGEDPASPRPQAGLDVPRGRGAVFAVLGHAAAPARLRRACSQVRRAPPHPRRRDPGRGALLPRAVRQAPGGAHGRSGLGWGGRVVRTRHTPQRRARQSRGPRPIRRQARRRIRQNRPDHLRRQQ